MSVSDNSSSLFQQDVYEQTFSEIRDLKRSLPEEVVVSLAREVLVRLSAHFDEDIKNVGVITEEQIEELAHALICADASQAAKLVTAEHDTGTPIKTLYLTYLAGAALVLGEWWEQDKTSFAQVITGTGRIYAIMRGLRPVFAGGDLSLPTKSAIFATVPGETHILGIKMAAELLRAEGWMIDLEISNDHDAVIDAIMRSNQRIVGLSAAGEHALPDLAKLVVAIRLAAPEALIIVSGNVVAKAGETIRLMGVDAMADDYETAHTALEALWVSARG